MFCISVNLNKKNTCIDEQIMWIFSDITKYSGLNSFFNINSCIQHLLISSIQYLQRF
jgi:hypothetical protein